MCDKMRREVSQCWFEFDDIVCLDEISRLEVSISLEAQTAFHSLPDFVDV